MKQTDKQKMCANCDGRIAHEAMLCPYCGTEQVEPVEKLAQAPLFTNQSLHDSLTSLYTPPYSQRAPAYTVEEPAKKRAETFKEAKQPFQTAQAATHAIPLRAAAEEEETASPKSMFLPILLLSLGSNLFALGILQFFFSTKGFLRLEWDASYWFVYCLLSLPLLYLGVRRKAK